LTTLRWGVQEAEADFVKMMELNPDCDAEAKDALDRVREELAALG
jgi:hypothetical protein